MIKPTLRKALSEDAETVASLERLLFSDAWSPSSVEGTLLSPFSTGLLLTAEGKAAGYLLFSHLAPEGELLRIGVHPDFRRRGYAACLMEKMKALLVEQGCTDIFLEVRADNGAAIALYRRFGFEDNGLRHGYYHDPDADALLMRLSLSDEHRNA